MAFPFDMYEDKCKKELKKEYLDKDEKDYL